ncbi:MAG: hypothetical protein AB2L14_02725 [Candidatus Xenobiia bacterium LiM19]
MKTELREISCYTTSNVFTCSICATRTSRVEGVIETKEEIRWLCPDCYRKVLHGKLLAS